MAKKILYFLGQINPFYLAIGYVFFQAYLYFSPYIHNAAGSFYFIVADPELFPHDIIKTSTLGTSTFFYQFMHLILGVNMLNPYLLFIPYLASCLLVSWGLYLVGKLLGNEKAVGFLMLILLLVDKSPFTGYLSITRPDYNYQHFTLPFLILAVYCLLKEKHLYFSLLMVFSFYFHVRNTMVFGLALLPLLAYKIWENPKNFWPLVLPTILLIPKVFLLFKGVYGSNTFSPGEKSEYLQLMFLREEEEGAIVFNEAGSLEMIVYTLLAAVGIFTARYVEDKRLRRSIYLCHAGVYFAYAVGIFLRIVNHYGGNVGELMLLGYGRASVVGTLVTMGTLANYFYRKFSLCLEKRNFLLLGIFLAGFWFLSSNNLYLRSIESFIVNWLSKKMFLKIFFSLVIAAGIVLMIRMAEFRVKVYTVVVLLLCISVGYVVVKIPGRMYKAYQAGYPYFPLLPDFAAFNPRLYDLGAWVQKNTQKDDTFLMTEKGGKEEDDYCNGGFRISLQRSVWCQGVIGAYGNPDAFREWKRRRAVLREYLERPRDQWSEFTRQEQIDYIIAGKDFVWPNRNNIVFENDEFVVYDVRHKN